MTTVQFLFLKTECCYFSCDSLLKLFVARNEKLAVHIDREWGLMSISPSYLMFHFCVTFFSFFFAFVVNCFLHSLFSYVLNRLSCSMYCLLLPLYRFLFCFGSTRRTFRDRKTSYNNASDGTARWRRCTAWWGRCDEPVMTVSWSCLTTPRVSTSLAPCAGKTRGEEQDASFFSGDTNWELFDLALQPAITYRLSVGEIYQHLAQ